MVLFRVIKGANRADRRQTEPCLIRLGRNRSRDFLADLARIGVDVCSWRRSIPRSPAGLSVVSARFFPGKRRPSGKPRVYPNPRAIDLIRYYWKSLFTVGLRICVPWRPEIESPRQSCNPTLPSFTRPCLHSPNPAFIHPTLPSFTQPCLHSPNPAFIHPTHRRFLL